MSKPVKKSITVRLCESRPASRVKVYDDQCPGFYVSVTPNGVATFFFKYWDRAQGKQAAVRVGDYHPEHLTIEAARWTAFDLKGRVGRGEDIAQTARQAKAQQAKLSGKTVASLITEYTEWMKEPVLKKDGGIRPRIESWSNYSGFLRRFLRPTLGSMVASEVTNDHIARLIDDVRRGRVNRKYKGTAANARQTRDRISALFAWAAEAGRRYVLVSPCHNLPSLEPVRKRSRVLTEDEIRIFWHGLDRPDLPCSRAVAQGLKFALASMLRSREFMTARPQELERLGTPEAQIRVPLRKVKKRREVVQPLSSLAQEILAEAVISQDQALVFPGGDGEPLQRCTLSRALAGHWDTWRGKKIWRPGICELLGLAKFTPHDLRRTAASLAFELGFSMVDVGSCLDHNKSKGDDAPAQVTGVYVREGIFRKSRKQETKRRILEAVGEALREIVGDRPPVALPAPLPAIPADLPLAA